MKDNFSSDSQAYARFRPGYPPELFEWLLKLVNDRSAAWDCGTGNGQVASVLADDFEKVYATDISRQQLDAATQRPNIIYSVQPAEKTDFNDRQFSLVTVAQAIHWFRFDAFYEEVRRVLRPDGIFAVLGYGIFRSEKRIQEITDHFYHNIVGPFWDEERHYLDENYQTIPFPFNEIEAPAFEAKYNWTPDQLMGYLGTWSAVKHYRERNNEDPLVKIADELKAAWPPGKTITFIFPTLLRAGKL